MIKFIPLFLFMACVITMSFILKDNSPAEKNDIEAFDKISITGGGNVYIYYSKTPTLEISGSESCTKNIKSNVSSGTLEIIINDSSCTPDIIIGTSSLNEIEQNNGGIITVREGFPEADSFKCLINNGGNVDISKININSLIAVINSGGKISTYVENELRGNINNGGEIIYEGLPQVESNISNGGRITQK
ncbi:GIN domain-containing protein [Marinigracilibium pacificum]|uniref:Putative auto-transporter adhesin head GIN domain-containing protein n=1 Tax=Marinigracilibium pacificum TaxID=2729599 RepID=A0A848J607_9BACT|nr:DUF2807 domain-containing protein [Marinigracilibium pacificum]NMM50678.1 hypothetical protein [Marinigracilibium pacificum]